MAVEGNFVFPGIFDLLQQGDERSLHQAGFDSAAVAFDPRDVFPDDTDLRTPESPGPENEQLPQFGPPFVRFVSQRFDNLERRISDREMRRWAYEPVTVFFIAAVQTTAAGGLDLGTTPNCVLFEVDPGFTLALHRLVIKDAAHTFGSPYTAAGAYYELRANNEIIDGNSLVSGQGQLPTIGTWGTRDAPHVRDGEVLSLFMSGGPASTQILVKGQGTMQRSPEA